MIKNIHEMFATRKRNKIKQQIITSTREVLMTPYDNKEEIPRLETMTWRLSSEHVLMLSRMTHGDLVEIYEGEVVKVSWVDQSHAYGGLLGINDVFFGFDMSNDDLNLILQLLKDKFQEKQE
jgi:hypothetical protein